jgi:hypothetical protein
MSDDIYCVMDGRAAGDPDDATVLYSTEDAKDACRMANGGSLGGGVLVVKNATEVMWHWYATGKWKVNDRAT